MAEADTTPEESADSRSYALTASRGVTLTTAVSLVGRTSSFIAQLLLGWLLSQHDFGIFALAVSISALLTAFMHGGAIEYLMQRSRNYRSFFPSVAAISFVSNCLIGGLIAIIAPYAAAWYEVTEVQSLLYLFAIATPLNTPGRLYIAKLNAELRFRESNYINLTSSVCRHLSVVAFAASGFGALSFALPLLIVAIVEGVMGRWLAGPLPLRNMWTWSSIRQVLSITRWILIAALAKALIGQADYLIIGKLETGELLGLYFFGFQLVFALFGVLALPVRTVMLPMLSHLNHDLPRQRRGFIRTVRLMFFACVPICLTLTVVAEPMIHLLWAGRWDASVPVVQAFSISLCFWTMWPLCETVFLARGAWRTYASLRFLNGLGIACAALLGAMVGSLTSIAIAVAGFQAVSSLGQLLLAGKFLNTFPKEICKEIAKPSLAGFIALITAFTARYTFLTTTTPLVIMLTSCLIFFATYGALASILLRAEISESLQLLKPRSSPSQTNADLQKY